MLRFLCCATCAALLLPAAAAAQCEGITASQDDVFLVIDHAVQYNCAVFAMHHEVALEGAVLSVTETATADGWADCYCPYASKVVVGGLAPGDYTLVYAYGEMVEGEEPPVFTVCELPFTIEAALPVGSPLLVHVTASGCGMPPTSVPSEWPESRGRTWSEVKGLYH